MIDKDLLNNLSSKEVAKSCYGLVELLQDHKPETQAAASAVLFLTVCRVLKVEPTEVYTVVSKMLADTIHGENPDFRALRLYTQHEIGAGR
jgi:hypothetical protein